MKWEQEAVIERTGTFADGPAIDLPIAPFPGLIVTATLVVKRVRVLEGGDPLNNVIEYEPITAEHAQALVAAWGWRIKNDE